VRRKRRKKAAVTHVSYPVRILDWKVDYSLHLDPEGRFSAGPYWEHHSLELKGEFLGPDRVKGREVTITFLADRDLDRAMTEPSSFTGEPKAVGGLTSRGEKSDFIGSLPLQVVGHILTTLQAGKTRYVIFSAETMRYGRASVKGLYITGEYDPEDY
jgi:hypothetical protein